MEKLVVLQQAQAEPDVALFKLSGAIDVFSYKELKQAFDEWAKKDFRPIMMVDMTDVSYVGSSGWSVLFLQTAVQEGKAGGLILFGMSERVERSLNMIMPRKRQVNVASDVTGARALLETVRKSASTAQA